mgnify:CR=1 FL=1
MQFNSYFFIFFFLPLTVIGYFLLSRIHEKLGKLFLIGLSVWFYGAFGWEVLLILGISLTVNYSFSLLIQKQKAPRLWTAVGIAANIGVLFYFKYFNFAISIIDDYFHGQVPFQNILLPVGISFYTFQQIAYLVDAYRGECEGNTLHEYLFYILFYPKLLMGPLVSQSQLLPQYRDASRIRVDTERLASGLEMFGLGLFKKVILADTFARAVMWTGGDSGYFSQGDMILVMLSYTFQIYFDFSGYSDMAIGIGKMLNFDLPMTFDSPYQSFSIREFWKRWHISLTKFLTKYVYIPLGGNRKGKVRTYLNILIVFLISGIWHGANWTFILWGLLHGLFCILDRVFEKTEKKIHPVFRWAVTFLIVNFLWLLFKADSVGAWWSQIMEMLRLDDFQISEGLLRCFVYRETEFFFDFFHLTSLDLYVRGLPMLITFAAAFIICLAPENNFRRLEKKKRSVFSAILVSICVLWSLFSMSSESVFVYFGF